MRKLNERRKEKERSEKVGKRMSERMYETERLQQVGQTRRSRQERGEQEMIWGLEGR